MLRIHSLAPLLIMLLGSSAAFASDGYFPIGYGIKAQGMGGVGIALPQDALAAATNPAGMAFVPGRIDVGLTRFSSDKSAQTVGSSWAGVNGAYDVNRQVSSFFPEFGYIKKINQATTAGVVVYGNNGINARYPSNPLSNVPSIVANNNAVSIKLDQWFISPAVAYKPNEKNSLGLALNFSYQRFSAPGLQVTHVTSVLTPGSEFAVAYAIPTTLTNSATETSTGWGIHFGWTGQVTPDLTLAATWSSKINSSKFNNDSGIIANGGSIDIPENYGIGLAYKFAPAWAFAADISQIKYGSVNSVTSLFSYEYPFGSPNGPGFGWKNITVVKLAGSYDITQNVTLRAGYNHSTQYIPSDQTWTYFNILAPTTVQDHLTLGGTWKIPKGGELSAAYIHGFKNTANGANSTLLTPIVWGGGNANISAAENSLGLAYGWKF